MIFRLVLSAAALSVVAGTVQSVRAQHDAQTLHRAIRVLEEHERTPKRRIPQPLMAEARGVVIFPHVIKAGLIVGERVGHGVAVGRTPDGRWGNPVFVSLHGTSVGLLAGVETTDMVMVIRTQHGMDRLLHNRGKLTLGVDMSIAAGPVGAETEAGTDARLRPEVFAYAHSRGAFIGLSVEGAAIRNDGRANEEFFQHPSPADITEAERLKSLLNAMSGVRQVIIAPAPPPPPPAPRVIVVPAQPLPAQPVPVGR